MVSSHNAARLRKSPQTGMSFSDARSSLILAHSCPGETIIGIASIASPPKPVRRIRSMTE